MHNTCLHPPFPHALKQTPLLLALLSLNCPTPLPPPQDAFKLAGEPYCRHQLLKFGSGAPVIIAVGTGLALPGYTFIVDEAGAADLYAALVNKVKVMHHSGAS